MLFQIDTRCQQVLEADLNRVRGQRSIPRTIGLRGLLLILASAF
jgi:hypothetical protein